MQDILLNTTRDLDVKDGDLVIGESTIQHQDLLIMTNKGEWKENPTIAVGAFEFLKDEDESGLLAEVKVQFERDGMRVKSVTMTNGNLSTDAKY